MHYRAVQHGSMTVRLKELAAFGKFTELLDLLDSKKTSVAGVDVEDYAILYHTMNGRV